MFDLLIESSCISNITSLGQGNLVFNTDDEQYLLSTFKQALLKFKKQDSFSLNEEWFSDVELLTQEQFDNILQKLTS